MILLYYLYRKKGGFFYLFIFEESGSPDKNQTVLAFSYTSDCMNVVIVEMELNFLCVGIQTDVDNYRLAARRTQITLLNAVCASKPDRNLTLCLNSMDDRDTSS